MTRPNVSIIVPIYNVEKYLDRCLNSLVNQTLKDIEIILVDDGSPDNCPEMCDDWTKKDLRIKVIHKQNEGLGYARNSGLDIAIGEYVAFVDSDDYVEKCMFEKLYNVLKEYTVDAVICTMNKVYKGLIVPVKLNGIRDELHIIDAKTEYLPNVIGCLPSDSNDQLYGCSSCNVLYSSQIIKEYNLRFESERLFSSEDLLFNLDYMSKIDKVLFYPRNFYFYCYNEDSLTTKYNPNRFDREVNLYNEIGKRIQTYGITLPKDIHLREDQMLLYKALYSICDTIKSLKFNKAVKGVKAIRNNSTLEKVLCRYPIKEMRYDKRIFYFLLWKHQIILLVFMYNLTRLRKRKLAGVSFV